MPLVCVLILYLHSGIYSANIIVLSIVLGKSYDMSFSDV